MAIFSYTVTPASKVSAIRGSFPKFYATNKPDGLLNAILTAIGLSDEEIATEIANARKSVFLETAEGKYLDAIGGNYGVTRPSIATTDPIFRKLIRGIAWQKHSILKIFRAILEAFLGPSNNGTIWEVFQINKAEVIIEIRGIGDTERNDNNATYWRDSDEGTSTSVGLNFLTDTTKTWTVNQWVGFKLYDSAGTEFAITANTATTLTVAGTPVAGHYDILDVSTPTYEGDYFVDNESVLGSTVGDHIVIMADDVSSDDISNTLKFVAKAAGIKVVIDTGA